MPLKLRFFRPNPLPAFSAAALALILSFCVFLPRLGQAIQIQAIYLEKGPPGGPYATFDPCSQNLLIGEELRLCASIFNDTGMLDYLAVNPGMDPGDSCDTCTAGSDVNRVSQWRFGSPSVWPCAPNCVYGYYYFYQDKPSVAGAYLYPTNPAGSLSAVTATPLPFFWNPSKSSTTYIQSCVQYAEWIFLAEAIDNFNFNLFAITNRDDINSGFVNFTASEGTTLSGGRCGTSYAPDLNCPDCTDVITPCNINIVSPLNASTTIFVTSFGTRPIGTAYIEDDLEAVTNITNVGIPAANIIPGLACGEANKSPGSVLTVFSTTWFGGCVTPERECGSPALPAIIPGSGGTASFTWSYTVQGGDGSPGGIGSGGVFVETRIKGTPSASTTLVVIPAPMTMAVTLFVDPDGGGPWPPVPLGPDPGDPLNDGKAGILYYMAAETLQVRATMVNQSPYTYEVHPLLVVTGRSGLPTYELVSGPAIPQIMPAGAGSPVSFTWVYRANITSTAMGDCLTADTTPNLSVTVQDRGHLFSKEITVMNHPFYDPSCPGGYISFNATDIAFLYESFPVVVNLRNNDRRKVYMAPPLTVTLFVDDAWGAVTLVSTPSPDLPVLWNAGETKGFTWTFTSNGLLPSCTIMLESALLWPPTSAFRCVNAASEQPPKCTTFRARVEIIPKPDVYIDHFAFTGPPVVTAFDQNIPLEMCLVNSSPTTTVTITSFCPKPFPPGAQGIEVDTNVNHNGIIATNWPPTPLLPVSIAPSASAYFHWSIIANDCSGPVISAPDFYFGCFNAGWGNNMVKGNPALSLKGVTSNTIQATIPVLLDCGTSPEKTQYSVGQIIRVYQRVQNLGQNDAQYFSATLLVESNPAGTVKFLSQTPVSQDPTITGVGVCQPEPRLGMSVLYEYDFEAMAKGFVRFTTTLTGIDSVSTFHKRESAPCLTPWLRIADPGILEMTIAATPLVTLTRPCSTCPVISECPTKSENCVKVDMSLKNRGEISLIEVQPSFISMAPCPTDPVNCPSCDPNLCPGSRTYTGDVSIFPFPDMVPVLPPTGDLLAEGDIRHYSWTFTPTALGCVKFYMQATSKDAATGKIWNPLDYSNCVNIVERRPVEIRLLTPQSAVTSGQEFEVSIDIYNPGFTDVIMRGGEPALIFVNPATGAAITERFEVRIPTPVTVVSGTHVVIKAKVKVLPGAPIGIVEIRIPQFSMYAATDSVTGAPVSVVNVGDSKSVEIRSPHWGLGPFVPNPYRPRVDPPVIINYSVGEAARIKIKVYTISGELVKTLMDGQSDMGVWKTVWDGRNTGNRVVASGIYILHIESPGFNEVKKLAVVK